VVVRSIELGSLAGSYDALIAFRARSRVTEITPRTLRSCATAEEGRLAEKPLITRSR
jgi:hypothetical protein